MLLGEIGFLCQNVSLKGFTSKVFHYFFDELNKDMMIDSSDSPAGAAAAALYGSV